jgi:dTDP-4-amino-4,6-dideoxygalactose transaminase
LAKLPRFQKRREEIVNKYNEIFKTISAFEIPKQKNDITHAWFNYSLRLNLKYLRINRDEFIEELTKLKIGTSVHFIPIHIHPYYKNKYNFNSSDYPIAHSEYLRIICLPLFPAMRDEEVDRVIKSVVQIALKNSK